MDRASLRPIWTSRTHVVSLLGSAQTLHTVAAFSASVVCPHDITNKIKSPRRCLHSQEMQLKHSRHPQLRSHVCVRPRQPLQKPDTACTRLYITIRRQPRSLYANRGLPRAEGDKTVSYPSCDRCWRMLRERSHRGVCISLHRVAHAESLG